MVNTLTFQGRIVKDLEVKNTSGGHQTALFKVAWSKKINENVEKKCFMMFRAWNKQAETIAKYFHQGDEIVLLAHLETEDWAKQGEQPNSVTVAVVDEFHFTSGKKKDSGSAPAPKDNQWLDVPPDAVPEFPEVL